MMGKATTDSGDRGGLPHQEREIRWGRGDRGPGSGRNGLKKIKGPELGISGPALRGVGGGRGLTARDAVCVAFRVAISGLFV